MRVENPPAPRRVLLGVLQPANDGGAHSATFVPGSDAPAASAGNNQTYKTIPAMLITAIELVISSVGISSATVAGNRTGALFGALAGGPPTVYRVLVDPFALDPVGTAVDTGVTVTVTTNLGGPTPPTIAVWASAAEYGL